jgi:hypothetical protein
VESAAAIRQLRMRICDLDLAIVRLLFIQLRFNLR